jgi:hypothetical protein
VAAITEYSLRMIRDFWRGARVREASGGVMYGPDTSQWPARWFDAVDVIQLGIEQQEAAAHAAVEAKRNADA